MNFSRKNHERNNKNRDVVSKNIKLAISMLLLFVIAIVHAQKVEYQGKEYKVKKDLIFLDGIDVTPNLTVSEQTAIKDALKRQMDLEKAEKEQKKAEKKQKQAEKKQKKAEKEVKKREKAQSNLEKAHKKYKKDTEKYEKLKTKGKLSPEDEGKWLKKLEKQKEKIEKAEKKVRRA